MPNISKISSQAIGNMTNIRPMKWLGKKFNINEEKALALTTVSSIIIKDGVGCAMYVKQSLGNDKIPEKKRKFVAALDLTNGLLMIGAQIALFFTMRKISEPIFNRMFRKSFNDKNARYISSQLRVQQIKEGLTPSRKLEIDKSYKNDVRKDALDLFKFIADIAAATIIGKRIVVPFIATPLASKVEKWMNKDNAKDGTQNDIKLTNLSMQGKQQPPALTVNIMRGTHPAWFNNNK